MSNDKSIPSARKEEVAAAVHSMMGSLFGALENRKEGEAISFTMAPTEEGSVKITASEAVYNEWETRQTISEIAESFCDSCGESPCWWEQHLPDNIAPFMDDLLYRYVPTATYLRVSPKMRSLL